VLPAVKHPCATDRGQLAPLVSERLRGVNVTVDDDVPVAVLGEFKRDAGRPFKNLLGVWSGRA